MNAPVTAYRDLPGDWKKVSSSRALVHILFIWAAIAFIAAGHRLHLHPGILLYLPSILLIGGLQNNLNSLVHHSIHGNMHPDKKINILIARLLLSGPLGQMYEKLKA